MGVKLKKGRSVIMAVMSSLILVGCSSTLRDEVLLSPTIPGESITSDQGYHAVWDDGSVEEVNTSGIPPCYKHDGYEKGYIEFHSKLEDGMWILYDPCVTTN